ncbi:MAG: MFS transporter [Ktedonobacterales bacterium]|nr:MFS transporter [Ktedonobacterales bacterium]
MSMILPDSIAAPAAPSTASAIGASRRNIWAYGLYTSATSIRFNQAIWLIYLAAHGYSPFAIGLFEMGFHLTKFVAEVPTGVFADLVGRRVSLIMFCALGAVADLLFLAPSPTLIAGSMALSGIAYAFRGGADSAMLWSLAGGAGTEATAARYSKLYSRMFLLMLGGEAIGTAAGGVLGGIAVSLPFLCQSITTGLGIIPLLALPEPHSARSQRRRPLTHVRAGLQTIRRDPVLLGLLLLSGLLAGVSATVSMFVQLYFRGLGLSLAAIGLIFALAIVPNSAYAALAPRLIARLPRNQLLATCVMAQGLGLLALRSGQPAIAVPGFVLLFYATDALVMPSISRYLNERAPEAQRATILSLDTGLFSAVMIVLFPLFGLGLTHISYATAYLWTLVALVGGSAAIAGAVTLLARRDAAKPGCGVGSLGSPT